MNKLKQLNGWGGKRWYYHTENQQWYLSATSFCKAVLPESDQLTKWKVERGEQGAYYAARDAAYYGTFMHAVIEAYLIHEIMTPVIINDMMDEYLREHKISHLRKNFEKRIHKDILAFAQWVIDKNVKVLEVEKFDFCEIETANGIARLAGTRDLKCLLEFNRREVVALVDFKSGGFWDSSELQLHIYKAMCPDVEMVFNWSPTDWRKKPSYQFKNQTNSTMAFKLPNLADNAVIDGLFDPSYKEVDWSEIHLGQAPEWQYIDIDEAMERQLMDEQF